MADLNDLQLNRSSYDPRVPRQRSGPAWVPLVAVLLLALGAIAGWYYWRTTHRAGEGSPQTAAVATSGNERPPARLAAEPGEEIDLPPLDESDALVRELVSRLSAHPHAAAWLAGDHLIRNFVTVVVNIANGEPPSPNLKRLAPRGEFVTHQEGTTVVIDPRTYARYDTYASAVAGLDARGAARLYATLEPRMEEAYEELGSPDGTLDRTLEKAIVELLKTPVVEAEVRLQSTSVAYSFADPALESLSHAQRQLLRMGPRNMRLVQGKLRELAHALGIPDDALPRERVAGARR